MLDLIESPPPADADDDDVFLRPGDGMDILGKTFVVQSRCSNPRGYVVTELSAPAAEQVLSARNIRGWYETGKLAFIGRDDISLPIGVRQSLRRSLRAFRAEDRHEILRRMRYCRAIDDLPPDFSRSEKALQPVSEIVAKGMREKAPDWFTIYRWWCLWARSGRDPRALCPLTRDRGNRSRKIEQYKIDAIETGVQAWLDPSCGSMASAYKACVNECVKHHGGEDRTLALVEKAMASVDPVERAWRPYPSLKTFRASCRAVRREVKLARRFGPDAARQEMSPVGPGPEARFPLQRVEADFKYLRLFLVDEETGSPLGTPYIMAAIDCYSSCIAGIDIGFDPPSYASAARGLKHLIGFKDLSKFPAREDGRPIINGTWPINGVPHKFYLDGDSAFHDQSFRMSARALNCHVDFIPPGQSWKKGKIERFWRTLQDCYLDMFPGKVLRVVDKPGRDYDPAGDAVLTLQQLRLLVTKAIVDVYHEGIDELSGKRRIDLWKEGVAIHPPRRPRQHRDLTELVGAYAERRAERRGIRMFGLRYNSDELAEYRAGFEKDPMVEIRYDPQDITQIFLIDPEKGLCLALPCTRLHYARDLSLHQHKVIQRRAKDAEGQGRIRMVALEIAKAELFALGRKMIKARRSRGGRTRLAQFLGVGTEYIRELSLRVLDRKATEQVDFEESCEDPEDELAARSDEARVDRFRADKLGPGSSAPQPVGAIERDSRPSRQAARHPPPERPHLENSQDVAVAPLQPEVPDPAETADPAGEAVDAARAPKRRVSYDD